jgi:ribosomal protein S18 acetylase RimI-like enzyme
MNKAGAVMFIREATADDAADLITFSRASEAESALYRGSRWSQPSESILDTLTLVGGVGTTVMGSLRAVRTSESTWYVESVFVAKECREVGIGDALMLDALRRMTDQSATRVESSAMPGDRATKNLFERHGLVAQTILVGKSLSDPSTVERASQ